jgi:hypothetical protein
MNPRTLFGIIRHGCVVRSRGRGGVYRRWSATLAEINCLGEWGLAYYGAARGNAALDRSEELKKLRKRRR